jgi:hypothetical protein
VRYDFGAYDGAGHLRLVVEAKRSLGTSAKWAFDFRRNLLAHGGPPPGELFAIVAPDKIYTWRAGAQMDALPDAEIDARPLLAPYFKRVHTEPASIDPRAFELLVAWWLEDVARQAQAPDERLKSSGLPEALAGARIAREIAA